MASRTRSAAASVVGWVLVALIVIWLFGILVGWIRFVLRSIAWILLIGLLLAAYFAIKEPPDT